MTDQQFDLTNRKQYREFVKSLRIDPGDMTIGDLYPASINDMIEDSRHDRVPSNIGRISDGYHTFDELYHHRTLLLAALLNTEPWLSHSWKSLSHFNHEEEPMFDGMFIVGIDTPHGQATYHCDLAYWDCFLCEEVPYAKPFDGHSSDDAIFRILKTSMKGFGAR